MLPADTSDAIPGVEVPSSPASAKEDHQLLMNAASVLKSQLVADLTTQADRLSSQEMMTLADKCYNTLEGLGDNFASFRSDISKLIAQKQELESAAKKEIEMIGDIEARYNHQAQSLIEAEQRLSSAEDKLSATMTRADSLKAKKEEVTGAILKLTEQLNEAEERIKALKAETEQRKEAHSVAEAELRKLYQYIADKKEFERMADRLLQLVRK